MVEYVEKDEKEGRILVRPAVGRNLPFGDGFEKLLLAWSFLNVMGYVNFLIFSLRFPSEPQMREVIRIAKIGRQAGEAIGRSIEADSREYERT